MSGELVVKQSALGSNNKQAGRDLFENCTFVASEKTSGLAKLLKRLEKAISEEPAAGEFIKILFQYIDKMEDREVIGLEAKLKRGNRNDLLADAKRCKLMFAKRLQRNELSVSAQKAYAHILAHINTAFANIIKHQIRSGATAQEIDMSIYENIIVPLYDIVSDNPLDITMDHIRGMLYYLTGNCYISWEK